MTRHFCARAKQAIAGVKFYCAQEDGTLINEQGNLVPTPGEGYQGPTIPTSVVDSALSEKPALELIERGETSKGTYENGEIGLSYRYPTTWESSGTEPLPPAKDEIVQRTRDVLDACSLVLLRLRPASVGDTQPASGRSRCARLTRRASDFRRRCHRRTIWAPKNSARIYKCWARSARCDRATW